MQVEVLQDLHVRRSPDDVPPPWLTGAGPRWQLLKPFIVRVDGELHVVEEGFVFDGSTIPRPLWWMYPPSFPPAWRGSCIHDKGVGFMWKGKTQDYWDRVLQAMVLHDGGRPRDARRFYWAVGLGARGAYRGFFNMLKCSQ